MLGFSTFSEATFSQASVSLGALAYLSTAVGNSTAGNLAFTALANITPPAATATLVANAFGDVDAQATTSVVSALATFSINDFAEITGQASPTLSVATASIVAQDFADVDAQANVTFSSVTSSLAEPDIDFAAEASITTSNVLGEFNINDFLDVDAQAKVTPSSVTSNLAVQDFASVTGEAQAGTSNVTAMMYSGSVTSKGAANNTLNSTSAYLTIYLTDFASEQGEATAFMPPAVAQASVNLEEPDAVVFDYSQFADSYDRSRVLYIVSYGDNRTVHIPPVNNTVYIDRDIQNYTVYIAA